VSGGAPAAAAEVTEGAAKTDERHRTSRLILPRRTLRAAEGDGGDRWYLGMAGLAALLAVAGGAALAARRFTPGAAAGALQVVSRVSLSPKHTVYLLRAGGRVLLVGTGPQGAPALISELDEIPPTAAGPAPGEEP
jgi:flagellar protein FliO/FliZ